MIKKYDIFNAANMSIEDKNGKYCIYDDIKDNLMVQQKGLVACMIAFVSIKRLSDEESIRDIADKAIKVTEDLLNHLKENKDEAL